MITLNFKSRYFLLVAVVALFTFACDDNEPDLGDFTGNEVTYQINAADEYDITGTITFKEKKDNSIVAEVKVNNTQDGALHPLHLHYGAIGADGDLAALLNPIKGNAGTSTTAFNVLGDEQAFTYTQLLNFDGSIKIHLDDAVNKDVVLAGGNIGINRQGDTGIKNCTDFEVGIE